MDRLLTVTTPNGLPFAELELFYDTSAPLMELVVYDYVILDADAGIGTKIPRMRIRRELEAHRVNSIEEAIAFDKALLEREIGGEMREGGEYGLEYDEAVRTRRYLADNGTLGIIDVAFSFTDNWKEARLVCARGIGFDGLATASGFDTNVDCILCLQTFSGGGAFPIGPGQIDRLS